MQTKSQSFNFIVHPSGSKSLITWADLELAYRGWFAVPVGASGSDEFGYSSAIHTQLSNGNILMVGHDHHQRVRELSVPTNLNGGMAGTVGSWKNITNGNSSFTNAKIGGLLEQNGLVRWTKHEFYNGDGTDRPSQGHWDGTTISGIWQTSVHDDFCNGYMSSAPSQITSQNYHYLSGRTNQSGAAINRWGPNLFAIRSNPGGSHTAKALIHHEQSHTYPNWWIADQMSSMIWVETPTKWGVLGFGYRGLTGFGYKQTNDPYMGSGGYTAASYEAFLWIYNPQDLLDVFNGTKQPWTVEPVTKKSLTYGNGNETYHTMFRGDPTSAYRTSIRNGRLVVALAGAYQANVYSATPRCYVFQLT